jgi:hypothetical protein
MGVVVMNTDLLKEIEKQLLEAVGMLALGSNKIAAQQLVTTIQGIRIVYMAMDQHPMTIGELQQAQFNKAKEIRVEANESRA